MHDVCAGGGTQRSDGLFLGDGWRGGRDGDFLGAWFVANGDLYFGDTLELGEGSCDVVFAASADHAAHFSDVGDWFFSGECAHGRQGKRDEEDEVANHGRWAIHRENLVFSQVQVSAHQAR